MSWIVLFIAGLLEVVWAVGLKYTHGFSRRFQRYHHRGDGGQHGAALMGDETLPVGTAYAVWTGIGAVGPP